MEENLSKALSSLGVAFIIIAAVTLFFTLYGKNSEIADIANSKMTDRGTVYQSISYVPTGNEVSGAVIIGCIKNGLETDISVDSAIIPKSADINNINFDMVDISAVYTVEYVFNYSGEVTLVKYRKSGGEK